MADRAVPVDVVAERFERLRAVVERSALAQHQARVGRVEEVVVEGPSKRDPSVDHRAHRPEQARPFPAGRGPVARPAGAFADVRVTAAAPHHLTGELVAGDGPARRIGCGSRSPPVERSERARRIARDALAGRPAPPVAALVGPTASGKSDGRHRGGPGRNRTGRGPSSWSRSTPWPSTGAWTSGRPNRPGRGPGRRCRTPGRPGRSGRGVHRAAVPGRGARGPSKASRPRRHAALLVGGTGLYLRAVVDDLSFPGRYPAVAAELAASSTAGPEGSDGAPRRPRAALHHRLDRLDPVAAGADRTVQPTPPGAGPRGDARLGSPVLVVRARGSSAIRRPPVTLVGLSPDPATLDRRIADRFAPPDGPAGCSTRSQALAARPGGLSRTARQALGYRELLAHLEGGPAPGRGGGRGRPADPGLRPAPAGLVPAGPPYRVDGPRRRPGGCAPGPSGRDTPRHRRRWETGPSTMSPPCADRPSSGSPSTTAPATTSWSSSTRGRDRRSTPPLVRALCDRRFGVGADGVIRVLAGGGGADLAMELRNADGERGRDERQRDALPGPGRRASRPGGSRRPSRWPPAPACGRSPTGPASDPARPGPRWTWAWPCSARTSRSSSATARPARSTWAIPIW